MGLVSGGTGLMPGPDRRDSLATKKVSLGLAKPNSCQQ